jgi:hypothetical protein
MAELVAMIEATGLLPTKLKNGGGIINITPQRMERAVDRRLKTVSKLSFKSAINLLAARAFWSASLS